MSNEENTDRKPRDLGCSCLANCSQAIQHGLESIFGKFGYIVGSHPWITIIASVVFTLLFGAGFSNWTTESRTNKLWIPQGTEAEAQSNWVSDTFGFETRTEQILLRPNDDGNVLKAKYVEQYWIAHYLMVNESAPAAEGFEDEFPGMYSWDGYQNSTSMCLRLGPTCDMESILDIVGYDQQSINDLTDQLLLELLNDPNITMDIDLPSIIGGLEYDDEGYILSGKILAGTYKVTAEQIDVNNEFADPSREEWELKVADKILNYKFTDCNVVPYFAQAFSAEFGAAIGADGGAYAVGCLLLIIYTSMALGKRDYVHSMVGLALCAILTVGLSILGSYGLAGALGVIYTPLSTSLPFLVLGLGVDDAFIIAGEFQQQIKDALMNGEKDLTPPQLLQRTMKHAGVSILITSVTDFVAFAIGSSTILPALRAFCLFAAFGVFFVFLLNITFFAACTIIDHQRANANRIDCCCCFKAKVKHHMFPELMVGESAQQGDDSDSKERLSCCCCLHKIPTEISRKMFQKIGEAMMHLWVKVVIVSIAAGMLAFSIYGATQLKQDFRIEWFLPDSSYLQEYYAWRDEYFQQGTPIFIYSRDIDYYEAKEDLLDCNYLLRNASYLDGNVYDWHQQFWRYINQNNIPINNDNYYQQLQGFLYSPFGAQYNGLIEWKNASQPSLGLSGAFMIGGYKESAVIDASAQVDAMYAIREDMQDIVGKDNKNIFGFTFQMLFWEQYAVIAEEFYRNLILACCVVFGIALILIPKLSAALLVLVTVMITIVDVLGFMWLWGLTIDAVTVCYTVIAIGLAVDYSAHVGEAFMLSKKPTKEEKVIDALYRIGASVFNGAFSTFLAVVAMANSQTYIFRVFFRQFFLVTSIGATHGLIVLPVLLSWFGPSSSVIAHDHNNDDKNDDDNKDDRDKDKERTNAIEMNPIKNAPETPVSQQQTTTTSQQTHYD